MKIVNSSYSLIMLMLLSTLASACGFDEKKLDPAWKYPSDKKLVKKESKPFLFHAWGLPDGVTAIERTYRKPLLVKAPDNFGYWEFRLIRVLWFRGKPFAIAGEAYFPIFDEKGRRIAMAACTTSVIIYDSTGQGLFTTVRYQPLLGSDEKASLPDWASN
jgi:hypothetical protein